MDFSMLYDEHKQCEVGRMTAVVLRDCRLGLMASSTFSKNDYCCMNGDVLGQEFHALYKTGTDQNRKKTKPKKEKKKSKSSKGKDKQKVKADGVADAVAIQPPVVEVASNPSLFAVFAGVRQSVLEKHIRDAAQIFLSANTCQLADSDNEDEDDMLKETFARIPKVVGFGLCGVFQLIRESCRSHPSLCTRALVALFDILQGQQPEGLKEEPSDVIDALFDLLLELAGQSQAEKFEDGSGSLTSVACSCLLSLVVARGDTGKILSAVAAMLMSRRELSSEDLKTPAVLTALQRSVCAVILGKNVIPDWVTCGIVKSGIVDSFVLELPEESGELPQYTMACDGRWLYLCSSCGNLYKIGTGYGGTIRGKMHAQKTDFNKSDKGWVGFTSNQLLYKEKLSDNVLAVIDRVSLNQVDSVILDCKDLGPNVTFTDGENVGTILSGRDDSFVVRTYAPSCNRMLCTSELPLKLARKCLDLFGWASFDEEMSIHTMTNSFEDEPVAIVAGKEFALMQSASGKAFCFGKAQSLGIKQGGSATGRWVELPITKSPKIVSMSVGHEGLHALLVTEDGSVFFVGTARRGEDGDQNKGRRQPKPVKPKKMIKVESLNVASSACNNGSSALVTRDGELYMFGKDAAYCHHATGLVTDLKDVPLSQVALGKAHVVALSVKGHVYTFGINNKGQCGREFYAHSKDTVMSVAMATANEDELDDEELEADEPDVLCPPGQHKWKQDECMVCTVCFECTGFGISCISKGQPDRNPGMPCGCGWGDSGCAECGCCKTCAGESKVLDSILASDLDIIVRRRPSNRLQDQIQRKLDERRHRHKSSKFNSKSLKMKTVKSHAASVDAPLQEKPIVPALVEEVVSSDQEREASKITSLAPARVTIPVEGFVVSVVCGVHHTVLLTQKGEVLAFGSNQHGQLGLGDLTPRGAPTVVRLPSTAVQIAAGSNHTVVLASTGLVYTFGSYQKGQLGRTPLQCHSEVRKDKSSREAPWFSVPGVVPNVGPTFGRRPTWVGASGDQTFLKIDESLINAHNLSHSIVVANRTSICLIPTVATTFKSLMINKHDGSCRSFNDPAQVDLSNHSACLDTAYNNLWSFDPLTKVVNCYNVVASEARSTASPMLPLPGQQHVPSPDSSFSPIPYVLTPMLITPCQSQCPATRSQAALHLLACLDTLALAQEMHWHVQDDEGERQLTSKTYNKDDFSSVNRFESHGGGWGYSGHSIEAIRFMADTDVLLGGFGLFGGRGEYTGKIKLFDIGMEGGDQEIDGELLAETEEMPYECEARQKYPMIFEEPVALQANRWYVAWARVSGPSSDCGSSGQSVVTTEDQVAFYFKSSKKSNNGTDVNAGQIPQLLYRIVLHESQATNFKSDVSDPVFILSREFSRTVTPFCLQSLLQLLEWSWLAFKSTAAEVSSIAKQDLGSSPEMLDLERLVFIGGAVLRLLRTYINEIYPISASSRKAAPESIKLVDCVADARSLLRHILSDPLPVLTANFKGHNNHLHKVSKASMSETGAIGTLAMTILEECHSTFVACFHAFYPTSQLKWSCLCNLLMTMDANRLVADGCDHLLAAILASLCSPTVKLTATLPILCEVADSSPRKSSSCGLDADAIFLTDMRYPLLVEHMIGKSQLEEGCRSACTFYDVLDRLLSIVVRPVEKALNREKSRPSKKLMSNTCSLLVAIVAELSAQATGVDADLHTNSGRILHTTPSRFTRTSQSRSWNTGNGSPDAICFSVDRPGIVVAGVCLYGGVGTYDYELELLDDQNSSSSDPSHTQRWISLEVVRGTFGPDDCAGDVAEVKFERPVSLKENTKYAIRLRNHGGRTSNGDGGLSSVRGPDSTVFTFTACSLSFNGTNQTRGQIPQLLYYSTPQDSDSQQSNRALLEMQARKSALSITAAVIRASRLLLCKAKDEMDDSALEVLTSSHVIAQLLPLVLAHIAPVATSDPRSAVHVLEMIHDILPPVAYLNNRFLTLGRPLLPNACCESGVFDGHLTTTSNHYAVVESEHPYKPATVATFCVTFSETVRWMSLEFDPQCGTAQAEDALRLYIPNKKATGVAVPPTATKVADDDDDLESPYLSVLGKFSGINNWPRSSVVLPGNEVMFSLETASDYVKDEKACFYGFKCTVVGFDWSKALEGELRHLEEELAYLGGMCASSLMRKDLLLPPASVDEMEEDLDVVDEIAHQAHKVHPNLHKGFALSHSPTVHQALEGVLPFSNVTNERLFLKDFVLCASGTSGGRLARWLQPDSYVDPKHCEIHFNKDEMRCGWPTMVTVVTKDQYEEVVNAPNLKLEVKAVPVDKRDRSVEDSNHKIPRISKPDLLSFGGYPLPNITIPYEVTVKDKMCYYAISMMKSYENYSFEELRYTTPALKRPSENLMVRANNDGTYSCSWTPSSVGCYLVHVHIDGFEIENSRKVEVKEPPQGVVPPSHTHTKRNVHQPNKVKKFVAKSSAGLRVRAHPSLQSEQIGVVHLNGIVMYVDELHNDDGVWVRLNQETVKMYCHNGYLEAWCLQYNKHLGRTLLVPVEEPRSFSDDAKRHHQGSSLQDRPSCGRKEEPGAYNVVKCGASGHNVRSGPSLKSPPVGMLVIGNKLGVVECVTNAEGCWVKLDKESLRRFCFSTDSEGWSLAHSRGDVTYLQHEGDLGTVCAEADGCKRETVDEANGAACSLSAVSFGDTSMTSVVTKPFDFSSALHNPPVSAFGQVSGTQGVFTFGPSGGGDSEDRKSSVALTALPNSLALGLSKSSSRSSSPPAVPPKPVVTSDRRNTPHPPIRSTSVVQKWLRSDDHQYHQCLAETKGGSANVPPELVGVSVKELVKVLGESRANGNEVTPTHSPSNTPPRPRRLSHGASPKPSPPPPFSSQTYSDTREDSVPIPIPGSWFTNNSNDSLGSSPSVFSAHSSTASPQLTSSPGSGTTPPRRRDSVSCDYMSHGSNSPVLSSTVAHPAAKEDDAEPLPKCFAQTGTQTSPDMNKAHFSIGSGSSSGGGSQKDEPHRLSPKMPRKDRAARQLRTKRERAHSPASVTGGDLRREHVSTKEPVKNAMSPLVAECLRTVFASFLWHEGVVHDAMACASFLKFHPDLPKQLSKVAKRDVPQVEKTETLSKEQKARLRHSVEVSASNFLSIQPSTAEAFARSLANANVNKNKMQKQAETIKEEVLAAEKIKRAASPNREKSEEKARLGVRVAGMSPWTVERKFVGDLPPSLQYLLVLWEDLTTELLKVIMQQLTLPGPQLPPRLSRLSEGKEKDHPERKSRKKKEWRLSALTGRGSLFGEVPLASAATVGGGPFAGQDRETVCELCGNLYPHPVTYHMRQAHPGCGGHAGGKGYNSGGNFCGGWAGNCGDGGVGGSSWYLICDRCREKYLRQKRQILLKEKSSRKSNRKMAVGKMLSPLPPMESHQIMKQNAMFLLDLASASGSNIASNVLHSSRRSPHAVVSNMPSVSENNPVESEQLPPAGFQCLHTLGIQQADMNHLNEDFLLEESLRHERATGLKVGTSLGADDFGAASLHSLSENEGTNGETPSDSEAPRGRLFHRSISVGTTTTTREWNREDGEKRVIMTRKRNKSSGEGVEDGSSLLCHPSPTLTKLVSFSSEKGASPSEILTRPIMSFILQRHDLLSLRLAMKQAVRKAACRAYAMQGLNWLLRNVTQPTAIHDLLWYFVSALTPPSDFANDVAEEETAAAVVASAPPALVVAPLKKERREHDKDKEAAVCDHPLSDITIAGDAVCPLVAAFHALLQAIADLMMMLPMGSALQQMAMRCWCLKFRSSDHAFLHRSHVFSNISKILSRSEEEHPGDADGTSSMGDSFQSTSTVECFKDLTASVDLKASSRPGMLLSLLDNSTETFWESGDEDRNKTKVLTITCQSNNTPRMIYVHIDNGRDLGNKVSSILFKVGSNLDELVRVQQLEVESRYAGWVSCPVTEGRQTVIKLELKGPDNTLRVRQVKILGEIECESVRVGKLHSAVVLQQRNCEAETLRVFRLLTSLVFGKLISSESSACRDGKGSVECNVSSGGVSMVESGQLDDDQKAEGSNDLKEHMVGILFSRSKLTHLQKQVCTHIVQAIRKETVRVREEWEALLCSKSLSMEELPKSSDAYCFEMLSMVLALSGSNVGRAYVSQQYTLLTDLLSLLHTGSARVQRQVTSLLRRVLPDVSPQSFAHIIGVRLLPPTDYSIVSEASRVSETMEPPCDIHRMGILDVFFSCIAKALTVQMKVKGKETNKGITSVTLATSIHPRDYVGSRWWLRGCITRKLAEVIIQLLQDMAAGRMSDAWATITKGAVAENILNLTKLDENLRSPTACLKTPTLWLALSSLCVLDKDHVERLSSGQWVGNADGQQALSRPTCDNHDDGETLAIILCSVCGNLCAECDRYLHLHRRTHTHQRQVFKEEEEAIRVDLHESCGRTKLFWIMALADSKTLKAMVEFREGTRGKSAAASGGHCRFCGAAGEAGLLGIGNVCSDDDCQEHAREACTKTLSCGHMCGGIRNEVFCLPCLHGCSNDHTLKQDADDMCMICFIEALSCAPAVQLRCGHVFHLHCCRNVLTKRWVGPRITFGFSLCPICKTTIDHPVLRELLEPVRALYDDVRRKAQMRLEYEGLHKAEAIASPGGRFYCDPAGYAMERYAYYVCYKCKKAYYGGEARCDIEAGGGDDYDPAELVCGACSDVSRAQMCPKHGTDFLEYKCRYCCSVAVFFCFGTTHFCNVCHDDFQHVTNIPKHELPHCPAGPKGKQLESDECPLHIQHPPTGEEFALGCGVCRNAHTF